jgi:hypothetical protein
MFGKRTTPIYYAIVKSLRKAAIERLHHSKAHGILLSGLECPLGDYGKGLANLIVLKRHLRRKLTR